MTSCTEVATFLVNQHVLGARLVTTLLEFRLLSITSYCERSTS